MYGKNWLGHVTTLFEEENAILNSYNIESVAARVQHILRQRTFITALSRPRRQADVYRYCRLSELQPFARGGFDLGFNVFVTNPKSFFSFMVPLFPQENGITHVHFLNQNVIMLEVEMWNSLTTREIWKNIPPTPYTAVFVLDN